MGRLLPFGGGMQIALSAGMPQQKRGEGVRRLRESGESALDRSPLVMDLDDHVSGFITDPKQVAELRARGFAVYEVVRGIWEACLSGAVPDYAPPASRSRPRRAPECHPDRRHEARGFCKVCWQRQYRSQRAEAVALGRPAK